MEGKSKSFRSLKFILVAAVSIGALLFTIVAVNAAFFSINTDDSSIADWVSVTPFATDPSGDVATASFAPGSSREDIVNSWVAEGTVPAFAVTPGVTPGKALYFRALMTAAPALREGNPNNKQISVYLDCNNNGIEGEYYDRIITYRSSWSSPSGAQPDTVLISTGDRSFTTLAGDSNGRSPWGQIFPTTNPGANVEWGAPLDQILPSAPTVIPPAPTPSPTALPAPWSCNGQIGVKFFVSDYTQGSAIATAFVMDKTGFRNFNVPTNLDVQDFHPVTQGYPFSTAGIVLGALLLAGGIAIAVFRKLK